MGRHLPLLPEDSLWPEEWAGVAGGQDKMPGGSHSRQHAQPRVMEHLGSALGCALALQAPQKRRHLHAGSLPGCGPPRLTPLSDHASASGTGSHTPARAQIAGGRKGEVVCVSVPERLRTSLTTCSHSVSFRGTQLQHRHGVPALNPLWPRARCGEILRLTRLLSSVDLWPNSYHHVT